MNYRIIGYVCGFAVSVLAAPASAAQEPPPLEPSSEWSLERAPDQCSLRRHFGDEKDGTLLEIASFGSRQNFRFTVIGRSAPRYSWLEPAILSFSPGTRDRKVQILRGEIDDRRAVFFTEKYLPFDALEERLKAGPASQESMDYSARPERPDTDFEEHATRIFLNFSRNSQVTLHTGSMVEPLANLRSCVDDLQASWGLDPTRQKTLSRLAMPLASTVLAIQRQFPVGLMYRVRALNGYVPVRIMVDADGNAGACVVQSEKGGVEFTEAVCSGLAKRFEPARDAEGRPTASVYITNMVFRIN